MECSQGKVHDFAFDLLPEEHVRAVQSHVASCRSCATLATDYRREAEFFGKALAIEASTAVERKKPQRRDRRALIVSLGAAACFFGVVIAWVAGVFERPGYASAGDVYELDFTGVSREAKADLAKEARRVVERRLAEAGLGAAEVRLAGLDRLIIAAPPHLQTLLADSSGLILRLGRLELYPVAALEDQMMFNRDKQIPVGFKVFDNSASTERPGYEAYGSQILVREKPVVRGRNVVASEARQELGIGGVRWVTTFELNVDGAKTFDEAAKELYNQKPPGMIAIVLDGKLKSFPVVQSPSFGGRGQISGAKSEQEARELAVVLRSGELPIPLRKAK